MIDTSNALLIKRLREMPMPKADIARAEADFQRANALVEAAFEAVAAVRTTLAQLTRQVRAVFVPQH